MQNKAEAQPAWLQLKLIILNKMNLINGIFFFVIKGLTISKGVRTLTSRPQINLSLFFAVCSYDQMEPQNVQGHFLPSSVPVAVLVKSN